MVTDSLRYWADFLGVDGFRFDLASVHGRPNGGPFDPGSALLTAIAADPILSARKLIAEPWDATGEGYAVGGFGAELDGMERPVPGHHQGFLAGHRRHPGSGLPAVRVVGSVRAGQAAVGVDQLRHRPRRLHPAGSGVLRPQTQCRERRGQPGRHRQQPLLELRRRGRDRRSGDHRAAHPAGQEHGGHPAAVHRHPDDHHGRRAAGAPSAATTTPTARTTRSVGWIGVCPTRRPGESTAAQDMLTFFRRTLAIRSEAPALRQGEFFDGRAPGGGDGIPDLVWFNPRGEPMTDDDWFDGTRRTLLMWVDGRDVRGHTTGGEPLTDVSWLLVLHADARAHHPDAARPALQQQAISRCWTPARPTGEPALPAADRRRANRWRCPAGRCGCCARTRAERLVPAGSVRRSTPAHAVVTSPISAGDASRSLRGSTRTV